MTRRHREIRETDAPKGDYLEYVRWLIAEIGAAQPKRAATYGEASRKLMDFLGRGSLPMAELDQELMLRYQAWLLKEGLSPNTIGYHMRALRAVYNHAVADGVGEDTRPFEAVMTAVIPPKKLVLGREEIRRLEQARLDGSPKLDMARDLFLFSYYTGGMTLQDMSKLRASDLQGDILAYVPTQGLREVLCRLPQGAMALVEKYRGAEGEYLFPIVSASNKRSVPFNIRNEKIRVGRHLAALSRELGLSVENLSFSIARYTAEKHRRSVRWFE